MAKKPSLRLRTHMSYEELEHVLEQHCKNPVQVLFEGLEEDGGQSRKVMTLVFLTEQDRVSLRQALGRTS